MNRIKGVTVLVVFIIILSSCAMKNNEETLHPTITTETTLEELLETTPESTVMHGNGFTEQDFEDGKGIVNPTEIKVDKESKEVSNSKEEKNDDSENIDNDVMGDASNEMNIPESTAGSVKEQTEYQRYAAMSGTEQKAYIESFESMEAFFEWLDEAKAYDDSVNGAIIVEGDTIDLSKIK